MPGPLPPLATKLEPGAAGRSELERLVRRLLASWGDRSGFDYKPRSRPPPDRGGAGLAPHGVPGLDGPVAFELCCVHGPLRRRDLAAAVANAEKMVAGHGVAHVVVVTPRELDAAEAARLAAVRAGARIAVHHFGPDRLEPLLRSVPALLARYFPDEARAVVPGYDGFDLREMTALYRERVAEATRHLRLFGLPPEVLRQKGGRAEVRLRDVFVPLPLALDEPGGGARTAADLVRRRGATVLLGEAGSGKSTLLRYLALACAGDADLTGVGRSRRLLPMLVSLRDFAHVQQAEPELSLLDYVARRARTDLGLRRAHPILFESALLMDEAIVLLDGLDEVGRPAARRRIAEQIEAFRAEYPGCPLVVTSRLYGYGPDVSLSRERFEHVRVGRLDDEGTREIVRRWFEMQVPHNDRERKQRAASMIDALERAPFVRRLAKNPLLVTLMASMHHGLHRLPQDRGELYDKCIEMLLRTWQEARRGGAVPREPHPFERLGLHVHTQRDYLAHLAIAVQEQGQGDAGDDARGIFTRETAIEHLAARHYERSLRERPTLEKAEARAEMEAFLDWLCDETGLVVDRGGDRLSFVHLSFQEYLAAWVFTTGGGADAAFFERHLGDPAWEEVLLLRLYIVLRAPGGGGEPAFDAVTSALLRRLERQGASSRGWVVLARALRDGLDFRAGDRRTILEQTIARWLDAPALAGDGFGVLEDIALFADKARPDLAALLAEGLTREPADRAIACLYLAARLVGVPSDAPVRLAGRADLDAMLPDLAALASDPAIEALVLARAGAGAWSAALRGIEGPEPLRATIDWIGGRDAKGESGAGDAVRGEGEAARARAGLAELWRRIAEDLEDRAAFAAAFGAHFGAHGDARDERDARGEGEGAGAPRGARDGGEAASEGLGERDARGEREGAKALRGARDRGEGGAGEGLACVRVLHPAYAVVLPLAAFAAPPAAALPWRAGDRRGHAVPGASSAAQGARLAWPQLASHAVAAAGATSEAFDWALGAWASEVATALLDAHAVRDEATREAAREVAASAARDAFRGATREVAAALVDPAAAEALRRAARSIADDRVPAGEALRLALPPIATAIRAGRRAVRCVASAMASEAGHRLTAGLAPRFGQAFLALHGAAFARKLGGAMRKLAARQGAAAWTPTDAKEATAFASALEARGTLALSFGLGARVEMGTAGGEPLPAMRAESPLAIAALVVDACTAAAAAAIAALVRRAAVRVAQGSPLPADWTSWALAHPVDAVAIALAWEQHAAVLAARRVPARGTEAALAIAHAAHAALASGIPVGRGPACRALVRAMDRSDPLVRTSLALFDVAHATIGARVGAAPEGASALWKALEAARSTEEGAEALALAGLVDGPEVAPVVGRVAASGGIASHGGRAEGARGSFSASAPRDVRGAVSTFPPSASESESISGKTAASEPLFAWAHLSDIHFGHGGVGHGLDQQLVLAALERDVEEALRDGLPAPDALFVTGDIAFSGAAEQYAKAEAFLAGLAKRAGLDLGRVHAVPGNHDIDRRADKDRTIARLVRALREGGDDLDAALADSVDRGLLAKRMAAYLAFAERLAAPFRAEAPPGPAPELSWSRALPARGGLRVRVVGLNTALLSADDHDKGRLRLGKEPLARSFTTRDAAASAGSDGPELVVVLSHHPLRDGWLADQRDADRWIRNRAHVHLSGHVHEADLEDARSGAGTGIVRIVAGAAHGERLPEGVAPSHGYSFAAVYASDRGGLSLRVWPRLWSDKNKAFRPDVNNLPPGRLFAEHDLRLAR